ncbi:DUF58 domain-containing protein [Schumannella luteola]|uniref:DUF58 domain-containing protein n=1 Tax=Schumannella luteola TaxID=472059 RepID=A0A852YC80_9MICO|nr:DUF58 domain-containing protein [Schumannella luteola]NYG98894.1 hypothetical protein [Schumannella luteola]TPX06274.1 DUF58 domain-containing protein [Schumannella luteola]
MTTTLEPPAGAPQPTGPEPAGAELSSADAEAARSRARRRARRAWPVWLRWLPAVGRRAAGIAQVVTLLASRLWGVLRPRLAIVSAMGWLVLLAAVVFGVAGFVLGWQEFVYLAVTLLAGLLVAIGFVFGRASFRVLIELTPRRVVAGDRALGRMLVANTKAKRSTPARIELPVGAGLAEFVIPPLAPEAEHEELFAVPTNRRAVIVAGPAVSVRGDQLGLLRRTVRWTEPVELFVHPLTARLAPSAAGLVRDLEGETTKTITNNDISFHALRAYEPGDDRRYVHWRTSARTGQLMVRQFEETRRSQLTIVFSSDRRWYVDEAEYELAVSVMASLAQQVIRDGTRVSVVSEKQQLRTVTLTAMLDDSCRLEPIASPYASPREFARQATLRLPPPSVAMIVAGSLMPLTDFRAIERLFGLDTQTVGFRTEVGATPRLASISGLRVGTVGELADLQKIVRRMS